MSKISVAVAAAAVAIAASAGVTQAGSAAPSQVAKLAPPVIHEPAPQLTCPRDPVATPDLEGCAARRLRKADAQVDALVRTIFRQLGDQISRQGFVSGERSWLAFRNSDCAGMAAIYHGGTIVGLTELNCEATRDKERLAQLRDFQRSYSH